IRDEAREQLVRRGLSEAFERHELRPLHDPVVDGGELQEGEPVAFSALLDVRPKMTLGEYRGLPVSLAEPTIGDEEVDASVDAIREKLGRFVPVDPRPAVKGDFILVDLEGVHEDGKGKDFKHENVMIEVGSENNLPEFEAALPGLTVGESRTFNVSYPAEFEAAHL